MNGLSYNRRKLIAGAAVLLPSITVGRAFAAPNSGSRLLVIFLRGAYDATNIIVPTATDFYHEARPTIGLRKPDPKDPMASQILDRDWSLHPALKDSMLPFWQKKQIAFIPFAGTNDLSRSHFETQDTIELGQPIGGRRNYASGFMGRLAGILGPQGKSIAFTDQLPLCFSGSSQAVPNLSLSTVAKPFDRRNTRLIESMYKGHGELEQSVRQGFQVRDMAFRTLDDEMKAAGRGAATAKGFELSAKRIGTMMRGQFNLAFIDVGGWDTHVNQGGATGPLATQIGNLGRGISAFAEAMGGEAWRTTTVIVISEFGRTFRENGANGTDHGHGSIYWVLGGGVSGGRMAGEQTTISAETLNDQRDLPVLTEYRGLIGGIVKRQFGLGTSQLNKLFPDASPLDLRLL